MISYYFWLFHRADAINSHWLGRLMNKAQRHSHASRTVSLASRNGLSLPSRSVPCLVHIVFMIRRVARWRARSVRSYSRWWHRWVRELLVATADHFINLSCNDYLTLEGLLTSSLLVVSSWSKPSCENGCHHFPIIVSFISTWHKTGITQVLVCK